MIKIKRTKKSKTKESYLVTKLWKSYGKHRYRRKFKNLYSDIFSHSEKKETFYKWLN